MLRHRVDGVRQTAVILFQLLARRGIIWYEEDTEKAKTPPLSQPQRSEPSAGQMRMTLLMQPDRKG